MAKSVGRPAKKKSAAAKKHAAAEKARYNKLPVSKRKAIVQNRDKAAQRKADEKRDGPARDAYRKELSAAKKSAPPKPKTCQWPGCKRTTSLQWHHQGSNDRYLCPTHHAQARRAAK